MMPAFARAVREISIVAKTQRRHADVLGDNARAKPQCWRMTQWNLDPGHSAVGFSVRHLMITTIRGEFEKYRASITYDPARPEATHVEASIEVASVNTREAKRDADLRGELFFDADKHPAMTFASKRANVVDAGLEVIGDLTIRGITHEVALTIREISGVQIDMRGSKRMGATATAKIKRSDFGMTWNKALDAGGVVVGDVVTIALEASLVASES
jgi:polyisoprenoid-binding protein YceI